MTFKEIIAKIAEAVKVALKWIATDGILHISVSALIFVALGWIRPSWVVALTTLAIGIAKEIYDLVKGRPVSRALLINVGHDLICDLVGILLGWMIVIVNNLGM